MKTLDQKISKAYKKERWKKIIKLLANFFGMRVNGDKFIINDMTIYLIGTTKDQAKFLMESYIDYQKESYKTFCGNCVFLHIRQCKCKCLLDLKYDITEWKHNCTEFEMGFRTCLNCRYRVNQHHPKCGRILISDNLIAPGIKDIKSNCSHWRVNKHYVN